MRFAIAPAAPSAPFLRGLVLATGLSLSVAPCLVLAQGTPAAAPGPIERVRLGDAEMSCAQLFAESNQMDRIVADAKATEDKERTTSAAASAAGTAADVAGRLGVLGRIGGLGGALFGQTAAQAGAGAAQRSAQDSAQAMAERAKQATARKEHVVALFLAKECKASDPSAPGKSLSAADLQKLTATAPAAAGAATPAPVAPVDVADVVARATNAAKTASLAAVPVVSAGGAQPRALVAKTNKVVIAGYRVAFVGRTGASASGAGSSSSSTLPGWKITSITAGKQKNLDVALRNIDTRMMQALTERMYSDFVEQLKASGLEVLPREALTRSPHYANVQAFTPKDADVYTVKQFSDPRHYTVLTPAGLPMVFLAGETFGDRGLMDLGQLKGLMFSAMDAGAVALMVQVTVDFAETSSSGHSRWVNMADVDARPAISLAPTRSTYITALHSSNTIMGEWGTMAIDKPVSMPGDYANVRVIDDPNAFNDVSKSLFRASVTLGASRGTVVYEELRLYEADPLRYGELALKAGFTANRSLTAALR